MGLVGAVECPVDGGECPLPERVFELESLGWIALGFLYPLQKGENKFRGGETSIESGVQTLSCVDCVGDVGGVHNARMQVAHQHAATRYTLHSVRPPTSHALHPDSDCHARPFLQRNGLGGCGASVARVDS
jgi:hypothetical protein